VDVVNVGGLTGKFIGHATQLNGNTSRIIMNVKAIIMSFLLAFSVISCSEEQNIYQLVHVGQSKQEIRNILGEPYEIKITEKLAGPIWGPEEDFWDKIPNGSKLEVWRFKSNAGNLNLYYIENNNNLDYKAFAPKGVVYESTH